MDGDTGGSHWQSNSLTTSVQQNSHTHPHKIHTHTPTLAKDCLVSPPAYELPWALWKQTVGRKKSLLVSQSSGSFQETARWSIISKYQQNCSRDGSKYKVVGDKKRKSLQWLLSKTLNSLEICPSPPQWVTSCHETPHLTSRLFLGGSQESEGACARPLYRTRYTHFMWHVLPFWQTHE